MAAPVPGSNQTRANYKYTPNMRNPPAQPVSIAHTQAAAQALHVKGKYIY